MRSVNQMLLTNNEIFNEINFKCFVMNPFKKLSISHFLHDLFRDLCVPTYSTSLVLKHSFRTVHTCTDRLAEKEADTQIQAYLFLDFFVFE